MLRWVTIFLALVLLPLAALCAHVQWAVIDGAIGPVANEIISHGAGPRRSGLGSRR